MKTRPKRMVIVINVVLVVVFTILSFVLEFFPGFKLAKNFLIFGSVFSLTSTSVAEYFYLLTDNKTKNTYKSEITLKAMGVGIVVIFVLYILQIYKNPLFLWVESFSAKGGLWALNTALVFLGLLGNQYDDDTKKINEEIKFINQKKQFNDERKKFYIEKQNYLEKKKRDLLQKKNKSGKN